MGPQGQRLKPITCIMHMEETTTTIPMRYIMPVTSISVDITMRFQDIMLMDMTTDTLTMPDMLPLTPDPSQFMELMAFMTLAMDSLTDMTLSDLSINTLDPLVHSVFMPIFIMTRKIAFSSIFLIYAAIFFDIA